MHIQSGVLDPGVLIVTGAAAVGAVTYAGVALRRGERRWGLAAAGAGAVLVAHLLDVPLGIGGTLTAHVIGGTLLAIAVGPWLGLLTMAGVLGFEALVLGDGGVSALGANVLVMGVAGVLVGWLVYRGVLRAVARWRGELPGDRWIVLASGVAAWVSVVASSLVLWGVYAAGAPAQLAARAWSVSIPHHLAWAVLEAAATAAIVAVGLAVAGHRARALAHADTMGVGHRHVRVVDGELEALG
ncbi:energy-coupling factor ABC transporter permease [Demequina maris]|uniref:energy-coupling factor ABC transporter permease n=1 Tax=Demequina maris TaxID=1638982 RepID=UPI0007851D1E|nr:energy-coupling factor ABC transporter permease [Demequina maris]